MTDHLTSKKRFCTKHKTLFVPKERCRDCMSDEIDRISQDLARSESARMALVAELDGLRLEMAKMAQPYRTAHEPSVPPCPYCGRTMPTDESVRTAPPPDDSQETINGLCDRLDRINQICYVENMSRAKRLKEIEALSVGFMPIPGDAQTKSEAPRGENPAQGPVPAAIGETPRGAALSVDPTPVVSDAWDATGSPVEVAVNACPKDGHICGLGGFCDECPANGPIGCIHDSSPTEYCGICYPDRVTAETKDSQQ